MARPDDRTNYGHLAELYLWQDDKVERLTFNEAPESMPIISPDSSKFAYRAPSDEGFDYAPAIFG